ncbi:MAG TPA: M48 family metallopeptidase [Actinomycetota bacterium]|nr:M48 family metallopeptidase [Actinomycetota bacterium]
MSSLAVTLALTALAIISAAVLAIVTRAPAEVRDPARNPPRLEPGLGASFPEETVERHRAYRGPAYLHLLLSTLLGIAVLALLARGPLTALVDALERAGWHWALQALAAATLVTLVSAIAATPLAFVRGFVMEHAWGLSTQGAGSWFVDRAKGLGVAAVTGGIAALVFYALLRWQPRTWWLWGWGAFTLLTLTFAFLWPILIAPLFNRFVPLEDRTLAAQIEDVAARAGVGIDEVLVADASRRSTLENAYVAGFGSTRRIVVYDTLLEGRPPEDTLFVVAHELGHERDGHVLKNVALASAGLLVGFGALALLAKNGSLWSWAGASGIGDVRALPLLLLFTTTAGILLAPVQSAVSRSFERSADAAAVELTGDPVAGIRTFRRLAYLNLADLDPPKPLVWLLFSHPPIVERIADLAENGRRP